MGTVRDEVGVIVGVVVPFLEAVLGALDAVLGVVSPSPGRQGAVGAVIGAAANTNGSRIGHGSGKLTRRSFGLLMRLHWAMFLLGVPSWSCQSAAEVQLVLKLGICTIDPAAVVLR